MKRNMELLIETLEESDQLIKQFCDASKLSKFIHNTSHKAEFEAKNEQLSRIAIDINLLINIVELFDRRKDMDDQQKDLADIASKLDEIALQMTNQQQELLEQNRELKEEVIKQHQDLTDVLTAEFDRRLQSWKFQLQQAVLQAQSPAAAKKIDEEGKLFLHIPRHDLVSEARIGQGGFTDVYRGFWISQHHNVAIKAIRVNSLTDANL